MFFSKLEEPLYGNTEEPLYEIADQEPTEYISQP